MNKELTFNEKITAIQSELKAPKNQYNSFGKYKYRNCEDILEAVKPLLKKYGLIQTIRDEVRMIGDRFYVEATVIVSQNQDDTIYTTALAREPQNKKGMDESQITGTASSYARKYALNGMWLIDDTKDADTDEHQHQKSRGNSSPKKQLKKGTQDWKKVIMALKDGKATINDVEKKFNVSADIKNKLIEI